MPALPLLPDGLTARPLSADDPPGVAAVLAAAEQVDDTGEYPDADDVAEWWTGLHLDPTRDGLAVCDASGLLVGFATVTAPRTFRGDVRVHLQGRVRPDHRGRGVGRALLAWQQARGEQLAAERHPGTPAALVAWVPQRMTGLEGLVRRAGMAPERWYRYMQRPLTDLPAPATPPGIELTPYERSRDDEIRRAHNAAFTEHHGSSERDPESWAAMFTGQRSFRPELSTLAVEDDAVVGYVLAYVYEGDTSATGVRETHFGQIGVLPGARGRGVAGAVIAAALRQGAEHGCDRAGLEVDSQNVTGALRLYEKLGFATVRTAVSWSRAVSRSDPGS